jgi:hypothetical protein
LFEREFKEIKLSIAVVWVTVLVQELVQLALSERVVDQGCSEPWSMFGSGGKIRRIIWQVAAPLSPPQAKMGSRGC